MIHTEKQKHRGDEEVVKELVSESFSSSLMWDVLTWICLFSAYELVLICTYKSYAS